MIFLGEKTIDGTNLLIQRYISLFSHLGYLCTTTDIRVQEMIECSYHHENIFLFDFTRRTKLEYREKSSPAVRYRLHGTKSLPIFFVQESVLLVAKSLENISI
jgi:hypothetical protein